jgi:hypothetical protein
MAVNEARIAAQIAARSGWCMNSVAFRERSLLEPEWGSLAGCWTRTIYARGRGISIQITDAETLQAARRS